MVSQIESPARTADGHIEYPVFFIELGLLMMRPIDREGRINGSGDENRIELHAFRLVNREDLDASLCLLAAVDVMSQGGIAQGRVEGACRCDLGVIDPFKGREQFMEIGEAS